MSTDPTGRTLRLLSLLQSRREWSGAELAERLGVTDRTVRRDVERLRELGYPVAGTTGTAGGYRLVSGRNLPPLLLTDDEAVAIAAALLTAAGGTVAGIEETSVRALAKLEQVLPARLRPRVGAIARSTIAVVGADVPQVAPSTLAALGAACRDHEVVSFDYRTRGGDPAPRRVEPHHLITGYRLWYLIGYDLDRDGWRTFRVDRIGPPRPTGRRFPARPLPAPDPATYLRRSLEGAPYRYSAEAVVRAPAAEVRRRLSGLFPGRIEARDDSSCVVRLGSNDLARLTRDVLAVASLGVPFTVSAESPVREHLVEVSRGLATALGD
ncbi:Predicted DNA-binding transcriptional regulator YafY, contains an HTH and WYL domains [Amycolatopsis arida]|uniref:Predicted DNA-binding transcriptional regulator YafY, contains an HTH and WYL domains n=1 Tax=Amycolatopsis arida TaxID=587909 RepID=A0A1I5LMC2_9PSEU|nr:WYL domain-containing protein [Amycolatopsis arida]TDX93758.1 putative DNA-binding transcriptional regulator YafY [Amycolatopsis arida]SFO97976.1 Predicted DNA-binding transcriptional regulator YafY, contains an HTH and WYL domains [Amycolatopsis arida]